MPTELVKRINLDKLYPPFLEKLLNVLAACEARGARYYALSGYRSFPEQLKLWTQGRTQPGPIVTKAGPGESCHNFGIAVDVCFDKLPDPGLQMGWNKTDYAILAEECAKVGLRAGVPGLGDEGHVQVPFNNEREVLAKLKKAHGEGGPGSVGGGLTAAWAALRKILAEQAP